MSLVKLRKFSFLPCEILAFHQEKGFRGNTAHRVNYCELATLQAQLPSRLMDVKSTSFFYAPLLGYIGGATIATTIVLCYILTVSLDHDVPVWLPMISRCAVGFPEKFLFRIGVVPSAALFAVQILVVYKDDRGYSRSRVALLFGVVACVSLILVGNVNEREWSTVHNCKE